MFSEFGMPCSLVSSILKRYLVSNAESHFHACPIPSRSWIRHGRTSSFSESSFSSVTHVLIIANIYFPPCSLIYFNRINYLVNRHPICLVGTRDISSARGHGQCCSSQQAVVTTKHKTILQRRPTGFGFIFATRTLSPSRAFREKRGLQRYTKSAKY